MNLINQIPTKQRWVYDVILFRLKQGKLYFKAQVWRPEQQYLIIITM